MADQIRTGEGGTVGEHVFGFLKEADWLMNQVTAVKAAEMRTEQMFEVAKIKAHLAKMDARDAAGEAKIKLDELRREVTRQLDHANVEATEALTKLGEACLRLADKLAH